ncbi:MAG: CcmD family protein [Bacteroidetes bacterium]|jgi:K+-transporting ATPase A subunit|nr:CcmD family protein [Bacteroidota bacterium]MBS1982323.1 CcmD family protein [Bacteroidota bacterium]
MLLSPALLAQDVQMADTLRSEGKIYVLVAIIVVILVGLITFLFFTDRKISRLEKQINQKK